jgi:hypothetical protein
MNSNNGDAHSQHSSDSNSTSPGPWAAPNKFSMTSTQQQLNKPISNTLDTLVDIGCWNDEMATAVDNVGRVGPMTNEQFSTPTRRGW